MSEEDVIDYDASNVAPSQFGPAPEGSYFLVIKTVNRTWTKAQDPMVEIECSIDDPNYMTNRVFHRVVFPSPEQKWAGIGIHFLKSIGEPWEGKIKINPNNWIGKTFRAYLVVKTKQEDGTPLKRPRNEITSVEPSQSQVATSAAPAKKAVPEDEVPF